MKLKFKKYVYLLNDLTNAILSKDRAQQESTIKRQRIWIIILLVILLLSITFNIYEYAS